MTPAELIALAEKHNILIPNAYSKDSFEETSDWSDEKWERFMKYYGYDESEDAILESIEYFEEEEADESEEEEEEDDKCRCIDCEKKRRHLLHSQLMLDLYDATRCGSSQVFYKN